MFLEISQNSQVFSSEFCESFKNTFFHRTPLVAACLTLTISDLSFQAMVCKICFEHVNPSKLTLGDFTPKAYLRGWEFSTHK